MDKTRFTGGPIAIGSRAGFRVSQELTRRTDILFSVLRALRDDNRLALVRKFPLPVALFRFSIV